VQSNVSHNLTTTLSHPHVIHINTFNMAHIIKTQNDNIIIDPGTGTVEIKGTLIVNDVPLITSGTEFGAVSDATIRSGSGMNGVDEAVITFDAGTNMSPFLVGTKVKVFGADTSNDASIPVPTPPGIVYTGSTGIFTLGYKYALMDMITGRISAASVAATVSDVSSFNLWNESINSAVTITRTNTNQVALIYRALTSGPPEAADYDLVYVWGPYQLTNSLTSTVVDYATYDLTTWSQDQFGPDNQYLSPLVHVPITPPSTSKRGWQVAQITKVMPNERQISLDMLLNFDSPATVSVVFDNTDAIQNILNSVAAQSGRNLFIKGGDYLTGAISVPDNVTIQGNFLGTRLIKQYWDTSAWLDARTRPCTGSLFYSASMTSQTPEPCKNITITELSLDGNKVHQIPFSSNEPHAMVSLWGLDAAQRSQQVSVERVSIRNCDVSAVYAPYSDRFSLRDCFIKQGPRDYQRFTPPLQLTGSIRSMVLDGQFTNWPGPVDVSANTKSVVDGNLINDCGTGLRIFATSESLTQNNFILGPADEWIPTPDLKDSDFNSVNINVLKGSTFVGPEILYVKNLLPVDLGSTLVRGRVYQLSGPPGIEYFANEYVKTTGGDLIDILSDSGDLSQGIIKFGITHVSTQVLPVGKSAQGPFTTSDITWDNTLKQLTLDMGIHVNNFVVGNSLRLQFNTTSPSINSVDWPVVAILNDDVVVQLPLETPNLTVQPDGVVYSTTTNGLGYQITGDQLTPYSIRGGTTGDIMAHLELLTADVVIPGSGYVPSDTVTLSVPSVNNTNNAVLTVTHTRLVNVVVLNAGTNLTNGVRTFTVSGGTGTSAQFTALVENNSIVNMITITVFGSYTLNPSVTANASSVDTGISDATFNLTMGAHLVTISSGGAYEINNTINLGTTAVSSTGTGLRLNCTGGLSSVFTITNPGLRYLTGTTLQIQPRDGITGTGATASVTVDSIGQISSVTRTQTGASYTGNPRVNIVPSGGFYTSNNGDALFVVGINEQAFSRIQLTDSVQLTGVRLTPSTAIINMDLPVVNKDAQLLTVTLLLPPGSYDSQLTASVSGSISQKTIFVIARGLVGVI
jgi:hypothetical protein